MKGFLILSVFFPVFIFAQAGNSPVPAGYLASGNYSALFQDAFSFLSNPALLSQVKTAQLGLYSEKRFMLQGLRNLSAAVSLPFGTAGYGMGVMHWGNNDYNETRIGLAVGKKLGEVVSIGIQFNYLRLTQSFFGSTSKFNGKMGVTFTLSPVVSMGVAVDNIVASNTGGPPVRAYETTLGYQVSNDFLITAAGIKETGKPASLLVGLHYAFHPRFYIKALKTTAPSEILFCAGLKLKTCGIQFSVTHHAQLGITPGLMLSYDFPDKMEEE